MRGGLGLSILFSAFMAIPAFAQDTISTRAAVTSPVPLIRPQQAISVSRQASNLAFQNWLDGFQSRARAQGIRQQTINVALVGLQYNTDVIARDRNQSEFSKALWEYLDSAVSTTRIRNGQSALGRYGQTLDRIEAKYGVEKETVVAIWGLESAYGSYRGNTPVIEALATLAHDGRRGRFFESQLVAALKIVQSGDVAPRAMTGSWAGAMGHTQFIPTSYLTYAVDFDGDGKRDIWSEDPTDALASTASYLSRAGWKKGQPWGVEVKLPETFNFSLAGHENKRSVREWTGMGVRDINGRQIRNYGRAAILVPAGANGPAFMIFKNFNVIERYNAADSYVIAVGHLGDRLSGSRSFVAKWPRDDRALKFSERKELQRRLTARGFSTNGVDGKIGPNTISAIRNYQRSAGMVPDGYASVDLLNRLR